MAEQDEIREILAKGVPSEDEAAEDEDELAEEEDGEPAAKSGNKRKRPTADVKKPTKKETASKKAKTEKAPAKKVRGFPSAWQSRKSVAYHFPFDLSLPRKRLPTRKNPFPKRPLLQRPRTRRLPHLRARRLLPLHQQRRPRRARKPRKTPAMVRGRECLSAHRVLTNGPIFNLCFCNFPARIANFSGLPDALANDPEASKVRDWRHKLQRAFLSKSVPAAEVSASFTAEMRSI